jgi:hypothetical protein
MRRSLSGIESRLNRFAEKRRVAMAAGCPICREDETLARIYWDELPKDAPIEATCACGRTYPLDNVVLRWRTDDDD